MSSTSGEGRLNMVAIAYVSLEKTLGTDHPRTRKIERYYHQITGNAWARRKLYEMGLGNILPDKPLRGNSADNR